MFSWPLSFLGFSTHSVHDSSYIVRASLNQGSSYFSHVPTYFKLSELFDKEKKYLTSVSDKGFS